MALKAILDSLDDVADGLKGEYEEVDGKYRLKVEDAESLVDTSGLKSTLEKERLKGKLVDTLRKEFPNATDDEIREAVKQAKKMKDKGKGGDPEIDPDAREKLIAKLRKELDEENAPLKEELETTKTKLRSVLLDDQIKKIALEAGIIPDDVDDVLTLTRSNFDLDAKDRVIVVDDDGDPSTITVEKFFKDVFKKKKPKFYRAPDAEGSDTEQTRRRPGKTTTEGDDLSKLSPTDRLTEYRKRQAKQKT